MAWFSQARTLELSGDALPQWLDQPLFTVSRAKGRETLGQLYDYEVELSTSENVPLHEAQALVDLDALIGQTVTLSVAIEGNGTWVQGAPGNQGVNNIGADVRTITGLIVEAQCIGADDRRAFYTLRIRPWLYLATLTRNSRIFQGFNIVDLSKTVLDTYPFPIEFRLTGPFLGKRGYPKRDYQRQWWETDFELLERLWQEWGVTYFFDGLTLVLCDSPGAFKEHGPAYQTIRYLDRGGQRIDEEHIHEFKVGRQLTTGKVTLVDYDYTRSQARLSARQTEHSERAFDNAEEYAWGDYSQPLASPQGAIGRPNDPKFEAEHLARVKVEAHRAQSLQAVGRGNLRGVMTGHVFTLAGYPLTPGDGEYLVVSSELEIVNNDTITNRGNLERKYKCETTFTAIPANTPYRTPQTAVKPRAYGEMAEVMGFDDDSRVFTDEYGRVKVRFVWDRISKRNDTASCWLQVASPWHGPGYGAVWTPRVGQMVQVGYFDSDPDRPYVVSVHSTDVHQMPWKLPKNSALSGWRSRDLEGASANSFVTDDTPGQQQVQVTSDHAQSRLVLGHNTRIEGHEGLAQGRGEGFELATEAFGVARANAGLLLTTEARSGAGSPVKDMGETQARLTQARAQHEEMAQLAQRHSAQQADVSQHDVTQDIKAQNEAIRGGAKSLRNPSPEMTRPDVVMASAAGIATTANDSTHQASMKDHAVTAGRDVSVSSGRSLLASVRGAISMFAYQLGIRLIAARGKVEIQAQGDQMALTALKDITVSSSEGKVVITAEKEVWIGAGGSYIQINAGGIVNGSPGAILEKGATWGKVEASTLFPNLTGFVTHPITFDCEREVSFPVVTGRVEGNAPVFHPQAPVPPATALLPSQPSIETIAPSVTTGTTGTTEQSCSWRMKSIKEYYNKPTGCADYFAVYQDGSPYTSKESQQLVLGDSLSGTFEISYDADKKAINASVTLLAIPQQVKEKQLDGSFELVSYDQAKDGNSIPFPGRSVEPWETPDLADFLAQAKRKIEKTLNQNGYFLSPAVCSKGAACGCRIPVRFNVDFVTTDNGKRIDKTVYIYPKIVRANAGNWAKEFYGVTKSGKEWLIFEHHIMAHEVGHIFGFPDEYYDQAGVLHGRYIKDRQINLDLVKNNPDKNVWQGEADNTLMGGGVYKANARTPPYYLSLICKWFREKNGENWAIKTLRSD